MSTSLLQTDNVSHYHYSCTFICIFALIVTLCCDTTITIASSSSDDESVAHAPSLHDDPHMILLQDHEPINTQEEPQFFNEEMGRGQFTILSAHEEHGDAEEHTAYLMQLHPYHEDEKTTQQMREHFRETHNIALKEYVPNNAFIIGASHKMMVTVSQDPHVKWIGHLKPNHKLCDPPLKKTYVTAKKPMGVLSISSCNITLI